MMKRITKKEKLLNKLGQINNPGYAKKLLWEYDRNDIKANRFRVKEWDYYLIVNDNKGVAFTIADNSYMGLVSIALLDFEHKEYEMFSVMKFFTMGKFNMPSSSRKGDVSFSNKKIKLEILNDGESRTINCIVPNFKKGKALECRMVLDKTPEESMVIATPFKENKKAFYYNQKINCMNANGTVSYGDETIEYKNDAGLLDWGRGVWTYDNTWYWGTASGKIADKTFGLNIGYGFGDTKMASENMIFYDGKAHKIDQVIFDIPKVNKGYDYLKVWTFTSNDKRLELSFTPILDRKDKVSLLVLVSDQHQVFGKYNGFVILDDGTKLEVSDLIGSAEVVHNRW